MSVGTETQPVIEKGPTVFIILPVHNRKPLTLEWVKCLRSQSYTNYRLILVDDGSTDGTREAVTAELGNAIVVVGDGSLYWAGGLQKGIDRLWKCEPQPTDLILFSNDDLTFEKDFLEKAVSFFSKKVVFSGAFQEISDQGLLLASGYDFDSREKLPGEQALVANRVWLTFRPVRVRERANCAPTRALFLLARDLVKTGGFIPEVLPHYLSDYEFTMRASRLGYSIECIDEVRVFIHMNETGVHKEKMPEGFWARVVNLFSIRYSGNPIYFTRFIFLVCPWWIIPFQLTRFWGMALLRVFGFSVSRQQKQIGQNGF